MYQPDRIFRAKDFAIALLAIYVSMTLASIAAEFGPTGLATALASLAGAAGLLFWFAAGTKRGTGIAFPVYFLAIISFPIAFVVLFIGLLIFVDQSTEWMWLPLSLLSAAGNVGFQIRTGPDAPLIAYVWFWVPNMLLPGFAALIARGTLSAFRRT